jgi:hypothetical protein
MQLPNNAPLPVKKLRREIDFVSTSFAPVTLNAD